MFKPARLILALALILPGPITAPATATGLEAEATTRIVLKFDACTGCKVTAGQYILAPDGSGLVANGSWRAKVVNRRAVFTVPTSATLGMSFTVSDGRYGAWPGGNAAPVIALGFKGKATGQSYQRSVPLTHGQKANWCWAGTTEPLYTIKVRSHRMVVAISESYENPKQAVYWAAPTVKTWHNKLNMHFGMGTQDVPVCRQPSG